MSKESFILTFGLLVALTPFLGVPGEIKQWIFVSLGLLSGFFAYLVRLERHARARAQLAKEASSDQAELPWTSAVGMESAALSRTVEQVEVSREIHVEAEVPAVYEAPAIAPAMEDMVAMPRVRAVRIQPAASASRSPARRAVAGRRTPSTLAKLVTGRSAQTGKRSVTTEVIAESEPAEPLTS